MSDEQATSRVHRSRIRRMRGLLTSTRIFAGIVSLTAFILVVTSVDPVIWNFQSFWYGLKLFIFLFEMLFLIIGYGISILIGYPGSGPVAVMTAIHVAIFGGNQTIMGIPIQDLITNPLQLPQQQNLIDAIYAFFIIIAIIVALIAGVGFLRECNPGLSAVSFFSLNVVLGLASLNGKLLFNLNFSSTNIFQLIFSKLVITAFLLYFSLELSFQASYIYNVIGPNLERNRRITSNIRRLKRFKMPIGQRKETSEEVKGKNTVDSRLKITTAFSQLRALVGKKLFRISSEEDWDKMNNRLKNFYLKLEADDPLIPISLAASAYAPSMGTLVVIIISGTIVRMLAMVLLTWMSLNPVPILTFLNVPGSIVNSVEAGQPEMIMMLLLPMAIFFMLIGLLVQWIQKRIAIRMNKARKPVIHSIKEELKQETKSESTAEEQEQASSS